MTNKKSNLLELYKTLLKQFGPQNWWPADEGPLKGWEICVGAILTQNTNWKNVEKAINNLKEENSLGPQKIMSVKTSKLQKLVKPSGFYKQKAKRLKIFAQFALSFGSPNKFLTNVTRDQLLSIKGIGPETADSILLYACNKPYFVIDAYTRRLLSRMKIIRGDESYDYLQSIFHDSLPHDVELYKEFHALIVENEKRSRRK